MGNDNPFGIGDQPFDPSRHKLDERAIGAVDGSAPTDRNQGATVRSWLAVVLSVHPTSPLISDAAIAGARCVVRVWRWKREATQGTGVTGGQWYATEEVTVSLDGDSGAVDGGPMEYILPTWDSEKMWFQLVSQSDLPANWGISLGAYGMAPRGDEACECLAASISSSGGTTPTPAASAFKLLDHEDYVYSNLRGDFQVQWVTAQTLRLSNLPFPLDDINFLAIGRKPDPGAGTSAWDFRYRDHDLDMTFAPATGVVTVNGVTYASGDELAVYIEGPSKTLALESQARRTLQINPDSRQVATDGRVKRYVGAGEGPFDSVFNMSEDGYHYLTSHMVITGDVEVSLWATNDEEPEDTGAVWVDITQEVFGEAVLTAATNAVQIPNSSLNFRRCRWRVEDADQGAGGNADVYYIKTAYGSPHVRTDALIAALATHDAPVVATGPQIMVQAHDFDGDTVPNPVVENDATRPKATLQGILAAYLTDETGIASPVLDNDVNPIGAAGGSAAVLGSSFSQEFDGAVFPGGPVTEARTIRNAASRYGVGFTMPVSQDGAASPIVAHDEAITAAAGGTVGQMVMGEAARFDGAAFPTVADLDATRFAASQGGVQFVMPVTNSGADSPLALHDAALDAGDGMGDASMMVGAAANSSQQAAVADGDASRIVTNLFGEQVDASHIWANQANRTEEDDPLDTRDVGDAVVHTDIPADATVIDYLDMTHFRGLSIQFDGLTATPLGVGVTVEASLQDDGTAPAACVYFDVTTDWFGAASFNLDNMLERDTPMAIKYVRVIFNNTGGATTEDCDVYYRRNY